MTYDDRHGAVVRPVHPGDGPAIEAMHARCSARTLRSRWHGVSRHVPRAYLAEVLAAMPWHVAVVAESDGDVVGLASARDERTHWEIAVVVEDAFQGRGIGRSLLSATVDAVRRAGGTRIEADVLAGNPLPLRLVASFGTAHVRHLGTEMRIAVDLPRGSAGPMSPDVAVPHARVADSTSDGRQWAATRVGTGHSPGWVVGSSR